VHGTNTIIIIQRYATPQFNAEFNKIWFCPYTCKKFMRYITFKRILTYASQKNLNIGMI